MKTFNTSIIILVVVLTLGLCKPMTAFSATLPTLGAAANFSVLASLSMSATGAGTSVSNNLGLSPGLAISRTGPWTVGGTEYFGPSSLAATAQTDALNIFNNLATQSSDGTWSGNTHPAPGVWTEPLDASFTGTLTLNGSYDDIWVFQIGRDMTFSGSVVLTGNAQPCHVFWQIGRDATIASGTTFKGTLIASRDIALVSGATVNGRIISLNGALTTDGNSITGPTCAVAPPPAPATIHIINTLINDNGGTLNNADFSFSINGGVDQTFEAGGQNDVTVVAGTYTITAPTVAGYITTYDNCSGLILPSGGSATCTITNNDIVSAPPISTITVIDVVTGGTKNNTDFPLFVDSVPVVYGVANTFSTGVHEVSETLDPNYTRSFALDCPNGIVNLVPGDNKTCIITNTFITSLPSTVGGSSNTTPIATPLIAPLVAPLIDLVKIPNPLALPAGPGPVTYNYILRNIGIVPIHNITMVGDTCSPIVLISGDTNSNGKLDTTETWTYSCSMTLSTTHTNTVVATGWANGISAVDSASATVIVGAPVAPPLIHVTKIPHPLVLAAKGGVVTYTNQVTNPGAVSLNNIKLIDDKCGPNIYISGDTNGNGKLDPTETWIYSCQTNFTKTTVDTVTASGEANGLTAKDFAVATVVVVTDPHSIVVKFPNTGIFIDQNSTPWNTIISISALFLILISAIVVQKKYN